jgi:malonyl-CoA/methylmalonyl-CoA synthetase
MHAASLPTSILAALDRRAADVPSALAVDDRSYANLHTGSLRVARGLAARGIAPGDRIALYAENSVAFVLAYLGGMRAGAVVVPTNVLYRAADLAHVVADADARALVVSAASRPHAEAALAESGLRAEIVALAEVSAWADDASLDDPAAPCSLPDPADLAILIYTSGTTGRSKGAMLTHGNLAAIAAQLVEAWAWTEADTLLLALPLFHVHGLGAGVNGTLVAGARLLLRERFDASDVAAAIGRGEVTMFFGVPTMYVRLLERAPEPADAAFARVRLFVSGSAALPASVHEAFERRFDASILERYGSTEFGFALSNRYAGPRFAGTVGFPLPGVDAALVPPTGPFALGTVGEGEVGEIVVSGPNVGAGYWRNAEATAAAFVHDASGRRWYRSGDLGTYDPERGYTIVGRMKELIISGGFNVYPLEVEDQVLRLPGVRAAAVVGKPDPARGELPVAFVEADDAFDEDAALAILRERLASFKIPKTFVRVDALPRNALGKVDKPALRARFAS